MHCGILLLVLPCPLMADVFTLFNAHTHQSDVQACTLESNLDAHLSNTLACQMDGAWVMLTEYQKQGPPVGSWRSCILQVNACFSTSQFDGTHGNTR